jgi:2-polyprenyl-6-methoxyphenol hydroxylase-like FAD-dependent oxidoreductase
LVPGAMRDGFTAIIGGAVGVAAGLVQFREPPAAAGLSPAGDYLMWAVSGRQARFPARVGELDPAGLHQVAARMLRGWHRDMRALVARAEVDETFLIQVRTAEAVPAWPASRVTVLGDAIHAMSPARGSGANTALQDAALLSRTLLGARDYGADLVAAIGSYEEQLRAYGFAAVAASRAAEAATAVRRYPLLRWLAARASKGPLPADPAR